jgi:hypothetical protein
MDPLLAPRFTLIAPLPLTFHLPTCYVLFPLPWQCWIWKMGIWMSVTLGITMKARDRRILDPGLMVCLPSVLL